MSSRGAGVDTRRGRSHGPIMTGTRSRQVPVLHNLVDTFEASDLVSNMYLVSNYGKIVI